jgi:hypothetical protein
MGAVPFQLTVYLTTPVALNHPWLHLDGIVQHLVHQRVLGRAYYDLPTKAPRPLYGRALGPWNVVLTRTGPLAHASVSHWHPAETPYASLQYFKRFEAQGFPGRGKVRQGFGHYRAWLLRWVYLPVEQATFYGHGRLDHLADLLQDLTHLGNDPRVGWGRVARWELTPTPSDWSLVRDGRAQRPIPTRLLAAWSDCVPLAWRPPYWAAEHVEPCAPPGAEVQLGPALASDV